VGDISRAIRVSRAPKVYVCNVATQLGETVGYSAADHVEAIRRHVGPNVVDWVLSNDRRDVDFSGRPSGVGELVLPGEVTGARLVQADLVDVEHPWRHDSRKLARAVMEAYQSAGRVSLS
jgi:uncharacterized cofD-like protein